MACSVTHPIGVPSHRNKLASYHQFTVRRERSIAVFRIISAGWDHPGWQGEYYPDDLPQEWRLTYFANDFPGVLIPRASWTRAEPQTFTSWIDDVRESFKFYLELNRLSDVQDSQRIVLQLGGNFGGYVVDPSIEPDLLKDGFVQQWAFRIYPCFFSDRAGLDLNARLVDESVFAVQTSAKGLADPKIQRALVESIITQASPTAEVLLILEADPLPITTMRSFILLTQLLGFA